jgi:hypothetical protein
MPTILPVLLALAPVLPKTTCRQLYRIVEAMLAMTGRITQLGISRWTDKGGSYRTVQRFFHTEIDWLAVKWQFFTRFVYDPNGTYLLAGDETVVTKSGKHTYGLDRFFSFLCDRSVSYFVLDGHFGNASACQMVRQLDLHLISKMRSDAALYLRPTALQKQTTPQRKYGERLDFAQLPDALLCSTHTEDGYETQVYRALCLHKNFDRLLNVVILKRTHLASGRVGHVILFSSDLFLGAEALIDYYRLRFQIEFTFRDAKQHFGLEDFMGLKKTSVQNAMSLSLFMVNLSSYLLGSLRTHVSGAGISDLKSWYRGRHYASAMRKMLPQNPEAIICEQIIEQICRLGLIHLPSESAPGQKMAA